MDLPTPPLPDTMPMTFLTLEPLFAGASRLSGLRLEQLALQVEQSWVQFSAIVLIIPFIADIHYYNPFAHENQVFSVNSWILTKICHIQRAFCRMDNGFADIVAARNSTDRSDNDPLCAVVPKMTVIRCAYLT
jgi:hypothetical protein